MTMDGRATGRMELEAGRRWWNWVLVGLILLTLPGAGYAKITKGPVLLRVYQGRAAIMWETDAAGTGKVFYGKVPKKQPAVDSAVVLGKQVESFPIDIDYKHGEQDHRVYIHKIWLRNLVAGAFYDYAIVEGGSAAAGRFGSGPYRFRTVPKKVDEVRFAVYGDSRSYPERHRKIVEQIIKAKVDFVVSSGDLVSSGSQYQQWSGQLFEPLRGLAESVPIYVAKGNHDKSSQGYFEKLLVAPGENNHFGFEYGPVRYWCGDQYVAGADELLGLMEEYFEGGGARWNFVTFHEPCLNFGGHDSTWGYPNSLGKILGAGVDFLIVGHSHMYERFRPLSSGDGGSVKYLTSITSGGGGAPMYEPHAGEFHAAANQEFHFCLFEIKGDSLSMQQINLEGKITDSQAITKSQGHPDPQYVAQAVPLGWVLLHQGVQRCQVVAKPLAAEGEPFWVFCDISLPTAKSEVRLDLELIFEPADYQISEPSKSVVVKPNETVQVKFMVKAKRDVKQSNPWLAPINPALWLNCEYETDQWEGIIRVPVKGKGQ